MCVCPLQLKSRPLAQSDAGCSRYGASSNRQKRKQAPGEQQTAPTDKHRAARACSTTPCNGALERGAASHCGGQRCSSTAPLHGLYSFAKEETIKREGQTLLLLSRHRSAETGQGEASSSWWVAPPRRDPANAPCGKAERCLGILPALVFRSFSFGRLELALS